MVTLTLDGNRYELPDSARGDIDAENERFRRELAELSKVPITGFDGFGVSEFDEKSRAVQKAHWENMRAIVRGFTG